MTAAPRSLPNPVLVAAALAVVRDWLEDRDAEQAKQIEKEAAMFDMAT